MAKTAVRRYEVQARSTDTFGRVLCSSGSHHFVVDGPVQNGCPGEAVTPVELFLASIAACGVELIQVLARSQKAPLTGVHVAMHSLLDPSRPVSRDFNLFNAIRMEIRLKGVTEKQGARLVAGFKRR